MIRHKMSHPFCPECGSPLSVITEIDEATGNVIINLFCEGPADDTYSIKIDTHLSNDELLDWNVVGSKHEVTMILEDRTPDPYYKLDRETMELKEREDKT